MSFNLFFLSWNRSPPLVDNLDLCSNIVPYEWGLHVIVLEWNPDYRSRFYIIIFEPSSCLAFSFLFFCLAFVETEYFFTPSRFWKNFPVSKILISIRSSALKFAEEHSTSNNNQIFLLPLCLQEQKYSGVGIPIKNPWKSPYFLQEIYQQIPRREHFSSPSASLLRYHYIQILVSVRCVNRWGSEDSDSLVTIEQSLSSGIRQNEKRLSRRATYITDSCIWHCITDQNKM